MVSVTVMGSPLGSSQRLVCRITFLTTSGSDSRGNDKFGPMLRFNIALTSHGLDSVKTGSFLPPL